jgi:NADH:ubiquinone oxidoreductase subunit 4 (subunit M)
MSNKAGIVLRRSIRYVIAVLASSAGAAASLALGVFVGEYLVNHGIANGYVTAITISLIGLVLIPAYIVKKLLVDYW